MKQILVTGANGFVGQALCDALEHQHIPYMRVVRVSAHARDVAVDSIGPDTDWTSPLSGCDVVVHLAARVHVMHEDVADPLEAYRQVNVAGTLQLARQAAASGVRRFIFLSSVKVNGESGFFIEHDAPHPQDPYGVSKWEAEQGLRNIAAETGLEVVILRSPLVYGPAVKANFLRLMRWVDQGIPLPFARINNRRSMIYLGNLVSVIQVCLNHPAAVGKTYLVSDGAPVSIAELIGAIADAMGRPSRLWYLPAGLLRFLGRLAGKTAELERLLGSLEVDSAAFATDTGWVPPYTFQDGIMETVAAYRERSACA
jgi:nucleoside-diphosphate-sugar epimerase